MFVPRAVAWIKGAALLSLVAGGNVFAADAPVWEEVCRGLDGTPRRCDVTMKGSEEARRAGLLPPTVGFAVGPGDEGQFFVKEARPGVPALGLVNLKGTSARATFCVKRTYEGFSHTTPVASNTLLMNPLEAYRVTFVLWAPQGARFNIEGDGACDKMVVRNGDAEAERMDIGWAVPLGSHSDWAEVEIVVTDVAAPLEVSLALDAPSATPEQPVWIRDFLVERSYTR